MTRTAALAMLAGMIPVSERSERTIDAAPARSADPAKRGSA
jgi:hypothetical protein